MDERLKNISTDVLRDAWEKADSSNHDSAKVGGMQLPKGEIWAEINERTTPRGSARIGKKIPVLSAYNHPDVKKQFGRGRRSKNS